MKLIINIIFYSALVLVVLSLPNLAHAFSYDSAVYAAQKGNWEDAHALLNGIMVNHPDDGPVVYDAGVAEYALGNAHQAAACFVRAAECAHDDKDLCFRSYFNAGNAYVDDKNLKVALEQYDKALAIEPESEHARHNRDRVAQMLQEQEKQEQKKENDQKNDQNKDDKNENQDNKDQQQKDQSGGDDQSDSDKNDQSGDSNDQSDQNGDQKKNQSSSAKASADRSGSSKDKKGGDTSEQESQGEQGDNADGDSNDTKRKEHGNQKQDQKQSAHNKKRNGDQQLDKKADGAHGEPDKQQGNKHNQTPEKQNDINDKTNVPAEGGQEQGKDGNAYGETAINDPWLLSVLDNQELRDKAINKQLMEAKVRQHGGKNVQNCW